MPTRFVTADLFSLGCTALAHGCNCAGAMGRGIAVEFKRRWPAMYREHKARCLDGRFRPGDVYAWTDGVHTIYNLGTQAHWKKGATLDAIRQAVQTMLGLARQSGIQTIALPRIGAGLGGLSWPLVRRVLVDLATDHPVTLVIAEPHDPAWVASARTCWDEGRYMASCLALKPSFSADDTVSWTCALLGHALDLQEVTPPVADLAEEARRHALDPSLWRRARDLFHRIREQHGPADRDATLHILELAAKATYNLTAPQAPFDKDPIPRMLQAAAELSLQVGGKEALERLWHLMTTLPP